MKPDKGVIIPALLAALTISVALIMPEIMDPPVDIVIVNKVIKAPIDDTFKVLNVDYSAASRRLEANGISIGNARTIEDIWINNHADPEKVIDLITE